MDDKCEQSKNCRHPKIDKQAGAPCFLLRDSRDGHHHHLGHEPKTPINFLLLLFY
jgi:hypothetical protein